MAGIPVRNELGEKDDLYEKQSTPEPDEPRRQMSAVDSAAGLVGEKSLSEKILPVDEAKKQETGTWITHYNMTKHEMQRLGINKIGLTEGHVKSHIRRHWQSLEERFLGLIRKRSVCLAAIDIFEWQEDKVSPALYQESFDLWKQISSIYQDNAARIEQLEIDKANAEREASNNKRCLDKACDDLDRLCHDLKMCVDNLSAVLDEEFDVKEDAPMDNAE